MRLGLCKLTGAPGEFVQAHLIPKALTRPAEPGSPWVQGGQGTRPVRRFDSWFDTRLVIRRGEEILRDLDTSAISALRAHWMVWSGWGTDRSLGERHEVIPGTQSGYREVVGLDRTGLRLFFLSLLWRAAATDRPEFAEVTLPDPDLETLRRLVVEQDPGPLSFYPVQLVQLSTRGAAHNLTPVATTKTIPPLGETPSRAIPVFRFYFDGLIAHFHRHADDDGETAAFGPLVVGAEDRLVFPTVPFESSLQRENMSNLIRNTYAEWPHTIRL